AIYQFITFKTGDWTEPDKIPGLFRPIFSWAKTSPGGGIFALALILLMFVAPLGIAGMWRQQSVRLVKVVPKPAGRATLSSPPPALAEG
ncbi:MAG: hypothetical protein ABMA25_18355, partial [Ilumatobacteraceae bacterium]